MWDPSKPLARKMQEGAHASGRPARPIGAEPPRLAVRPSSKLAGISGVRIGPGATAFTRILFAFQSDCDSKRVSATIAPSVAAWSGSSALPW